MRLRYNPKKGWSWGMPYIFNTFRAYHWVGRFQTARDAMMDALQKDRD